MGISVLMFGTFTIVLVVVAFLLIRFFSKPKNLHPMDGQRERNIDEIRRDGPTDA